MICDVYLRGPQWLLVLGAPTVTQGAISSIRAPTLDELDRDVPIVLQVFYV